MAGGLSLPLLLRMIMILPIVRIENEKKDGFIEINESDFDKEKHVLYKEKKKVKKRIKKEGK